MIDHEYTVSGRATVKVNLRSGRLQVLEGASGRVRIAIDSADPAFQPVQRGDLIEVSSRRGGRATVTAWVPQDSELEVSTASAQIEVEAPVAGLQVATASGDLRFDKVARISVRSASGDITGSLVGEEARCFTASGDLKIGSLSGIAELSTASGDLTVAELLGELTVTTVSGNVRIDLMTGRSLSGRSTSGDLRLGIPAGTRVDLDLNTLSGRIHLPEPASSPAPAQRQVDVGFRSVSGDVRIERV